MRSVDSVRMGLYGLDRDVFLGGCRLGTDVPVAWRIFDHRAEAAVGGDCGVKLRQPTDLLPRNAGQVSQLEPDDRVAE